MSQPVYFGCEFLGAFCCAPYRTAALPHGLPEIVAYQAGSGALGRRTEAAHRVVVRNPERMDRV